VILVANKIDGDGERKVINQNTHVHTHTFRIYSYDVLLCFFLCAYVYVQVSTKQAKEFAAKNNLMYAETSALTGEGVEKCLKMMIDEVLM